MTKKKSAAASTDRNAKSPSARHAFARVLVELRGGITQAELETLSGVSKSFIGDLEIGERQACLDTIMRLSLAFNVTPGSLLDRTAALMSDEAFDTLRSHR